MNKWLWGLVIAVGTMMGIGMVVSLFEEKSGFRLSNVQLKSFNGERISGSITYYDGDATAYVWVEHRGEMYCPHSAFFNKGKTRKVEFDCEPIANKEPDDISMYVALQPPAWVKDNALAL